MIPRVSVVLAARNEEELISGAIDSIFQQTFSDWELIVVDDRSTDGTAEVVRGYGDERVRLFSGPGRGLAAALNVGLAEARAEIVARQDADDRSMPERLQCQVAFLEKRADVLLVGSAWLEVGLDGKELVPRAKFVGGRVNELLPSFNPLMHSAVTFRTDPVRALGGYDERLGSGAQDYDLWFRLSDAGHTLWNLDDVLAIRTMTGKNLSGESERGSLALELSIRWNHIQRRRAAGLPIRRELVGIAGRIPSLLAPVALKRALRRRAGKAP